MKKKKDICYKHSYTEKNKLLFIIILNFFLCIQCIKSKLLTYYSLWTQKSENVATIFGKKKIIEA